VAARFLRTVELVRERVVSGVQLARTAANDRVVPGSRRAAAATLLKVMGL